MEGQGISHILCPQGAYSMKKWSRSVVFDSLWPHRLQPARLLGPWDFPGNCTGVDCHFLLQGIFPTQGSNPGLPHCRQRLYRLSHQGSPPGSLVHGIFQAWILEWVAISFSRGNSWPRDWTQVSGIAGRRFTVWATREAHKRLSQYIIWERWNQESDSYLDN